MGSIENCDPLREKDPTFTKHNLEPMVGRPVAKYLDKQRLGLKMGGQQRWSALDKKFQLEEGIDPHDRGYEKDMPKRTQRSRAGPRNYPQPQCSINIPLTCCDMSGQHSCGYQRVIPRSILRYYLCWKSLNVTWFCEQIMERVWGFEISAFVGLENTWEAGPGDRSSQP